jgi:hypothetical protein
MRIQGTSPVLLRLDFISSQAEATAAPASQSLTSPSGALASASAEQEAITSTPEIRGDARIAVIRRQTDALTTARNIAMELELLAPDTFCDAPRPTG